jgi:two-component system osmolarity sensor histidine kinase EnvZ
MTLVPATTFGRLALMIAAVVLSLLLIMGLALRAFGIGPSGEIYADLVVGNVRLAQATRTSALPNNLMRAAQAPVNSRPALLPAQLLILRRVREAFGADSGVRFSNERIARVWIRPSNADYWIGVRVPAFFSQTVSYGLSILAFAALVVLAAAAWFARHLTKPLVRLADQAKTLASDDEWPALEDDKAPREIRILQSAMAQAANSVRNSVRERELLLAGVSHDLRTPLARLRLAIEMQHGVPESEREPMVGDIEEMDAIVGQFLDYVRDGRDEAEESIDLVALLQDLIAEAARDGYDWVFESAADHLPVLARNLALRRAVRNLMRNAQLHGAPPLALGLELNRAGAALAPHVAILVRDQGPGLPASLLPQIGQPFVRSSPSRSGVPGSGLGLSLVQRVARTHGGQLLISTPVHGGLEARLILPLSPL